MDLFGNTATGASINGIWVSDKAHGNTIHDNDFRGNTGNDCVDQQAVAPLNVWTNDLGNDSSPADICAKPVD
jgi:parallel beta-helix repeat protein